MPKEPLGITFIIPDGQEATGLYEVEGGIEVFETDTPYLLSDGVSLQPPLPVFDAGGLYSQIAWAIHSARLALAAYPGMIINGRLWNRR